VNEKSQTVILANGSDVDVEKFTDLKSVIT